MKSITLELQICAIFLIFVGCSAGDLETDIQPQSEPAQSVEGQETPSDDNVVTTLSPEPWSDSAAAVDDSEDGESDVINTEAAAAGYLAMEEGDLEGAVKHLTVALQAKSTPKMYYYRGVAYEMLGEPDKAIADLSKCIEADPRHSRAMFSRYLTYRKQERWDEAYADIRTAYGIDSEDFRIANSYARMLAESPVEAHRDGSLAVKVATHACTLTDWEDPICMQTLLDAYRETGDDAKANEIEKKLKVLDSVATDYDYDRIREEIKEYFTYHFDKEPNELALHEIIPGKVAVSVMTIDRGDDEKPNVIFTTGMSELPMSVPADSDDEPFAEVCMYLPPEWPTEPDIEDTSKSWPWIWLRQVAHYPHENKTYIGEYPSVFPVNGPLKPPGKDVKFTALLLVPNFGNLDGFQSDEGPYVNMITAIPIYAEEYELAKQEDGIANLIRGFQAADISTTFDVNRPNTARKQN